MNLEQAKTTLADIFTATYEKNKSWRNVIEEMCTHYPTKGYGSIYDKNERDLAAYIIKQEMSDPFIPFGKRSAKRFARLQTERQARREAHLLEIAKYKKVA